MSKLIVSGLFSISLAVAGNANALGDCSVGQENELVQKMLTEMKVKITSADYLNFKGVCTETDSLAVASISVGYTVYSLVDGEVTYKVFCGGVDVEKIKNGAGVDIYTYRNLKNSEIGCGGPLP